MAKPLIWLKRFDREMDFVVSRPIRFAGRAFVRGEMFDKTLANTRKLRQLYDQRFLIAVEPAATPAPEAAPAVDWRKLPWAQLQKFVAEIAGSRPKTKAEAELLMGAVNGRTA